MTQKKTKHVVYIQAHHKPKTRLRRWAVIKQALGQRLVFAGYMQTPAICSEPVKHIIRIKTVAALKGFMFFFYIK